MVIQSFWVVFGTVWGHLWGKIKKKNYANDFKMYWSQNLPKTCGIHYTTSYSAVLILFMKLPSFMKLAEAFLDLIQELNQRTIFSWNLRTYKQSKKLLHSEELFLSQSLLALKIARPTSRALKMYWLCHYRGPSTKLFCSVISHITLDYGH